MKQTQLARKTILMIGAPGVGKGTYSRMLSKDLGITELSSGDELRKIVKQFVEKSEQGDNYSNETINNNILDSQTLHFKTRMEEGKLVNDEYIHELMRDRLSRPEYSKGVILDGYPRTYAQAKEFEKTMKMDIVLKIVLREDILIRKLLGRRVCPSCGKNYNICTIKEGDYAMAPLLPKKSSNHCDECDTALVQRKDDNRQIIESRLAVYHEMTCPLEKYYEDKGLVVAFEPKKGINDYPHMYNLVASKL